MTTSSPFNIGGGNWTSGNSSEYDYDGPDENYIIDYDEESAAYHAWMHTLAMYFYNFHKDAGRYIYSFGIAINVAVLLVLARRKVIQQHHTTTYFISLTVAQCVLMLMTLTREYRHVDWFCKLSNLVRECFFQAHGLLVAALVVDRCAEMTSRHVTSIVASTGGRYELPLCCSRWSSAVVSGIHKMSACFCTTFASKMTIALIFLVTFSEKLSILWTYTVYHPRLGHRMYCMFVIREDSWDLLKWQLGIFSTIMFIIDSITLIGSIVVIYLRLREHPIGERETRQEGLAIHRQHSLTTLVLCVALLLLTYRIPIIAIYVDYNIKKAWFTGVHVVLSYILSIFFHLYLSIIPILCFVFLRPATTYEVRYVAGWVWYRLRYLKAGVDDTDTLVLPEESMEDVNPAYETRQTV